MKAVRSNFLPFERNQLRFASRFGALVGVRVVGLRLIFNIWDPEKNNLLWRLIVWTGRSRGAEHSLTTPGICWIFSCHNNSSLKWFNTIQFHPIKRFWIIILLSTPSARSDLILILYEPHGRTDPVFFPFTDQICPGGASFPPSFTFWTEIFQLGCLQFVLLRNVNVWFER